MKFQILKDPSWRFGPKWGRLGDYFFAFSIGQYDLTIFYRWPIRQWIRHPIQTYRYDKIAKEMGLAMDRMEETFKAINAGFEQLAEAGKNAAKAGEALRLALIKLAHSLPVPIHDIIERVNDYMMQGYEDLDEISRMIDADIRREIADGTYHEKAKQRAHEIMASTLEKTTEEIEPGIYEHTWRDPDPDASLKKLLEESQ